MKSCSTRLLVLAAMLAALGTTRAQARPPAVGPGPLRPRLLPVGDAAPSDAASEGQDPIAWDCVPNYWWGYWTWAWQPCAWIDRSYVEGTIGAVAELATEPVSETSLVEAGGSAREQDQGITGRARRRHVR